VAFVCVEIRALPDLSDLGLILPGGIEAIPTLSPNLAERTSDLILDVIGQAQPAFAAFIPFLRALGVIEAIATCIKAIPEALVTLDPMKIVDCVGGLETALAELMKLLPQLSLPMAILRFVNLLILLLTDVRDMLQQIQVALDEAEDAIATGQERGDEQLIQIGNCARDNAQNEALNALKMLEMLGAPIRMINIFLGLLGLPCFRLTVDLSVDMSGQVAMLDAMIAFLEGLIPSLPFIGGSPTELCASYWGYNTATGKMEKQDA